MRISKEAFEKIKEFEGCKLISYKCPAGVWTIGYGHTQGVKSNQTISQEQADSLLRGDLLPCEQYVNNLGIEFTQGQFDALVDFCFNLGCSRLGNSTLLRKIRLKAGEKDIRKEFSRWVYSNRVKLKGLIKRREWEANRYFET